MRLSSKTYSSLSAVLLLCLSAPAMPSGGDGYASNRFASEYQIAPARLIQFAAGNVGVLPGTHWRIYHYLAFQAAKGKPFTLQQLTALTLNRWHVGTGIEWDYSSEPDKNGSGEWIKERAIFAQQWNLPLDVKLDVMGEKADGESYVNCHADAFKQASATLKARAQLGAGGKPDAWHKPWLQGQDAVFANCQEPAHPYGQPAPKRSVQLPAILPPNAPDWLKFDRAYQTAAANFYARNFEMARLQFQDIARDSKSPWQKFGAYLAARCLIRKATLDFPTLSGQPPARERIEGLVQAKKELAALAPDQIAAKRLISLVEARINPTERIATLARLLDKEAFNAETPRLLSDYLVLLDKQPHRMLIEAKEPLTAWIGSMQADAPSDLWDDPSNKDLQQQRQFAIETLRQRWLKQADPLWLAPLLSLAHANELNPAEKKAAANVAANHPLYQTLQYHLARLAILEKHANQADQEIDRIMAAFGKTMSVATTNRFLSLKMVSANSLNEFLKAAPRRLDQIETGAPIDAKLADTATETDDDFARSVFRFMPLAELKTLLLHPLLPASWKPRLQETILTRALIFNDEQTVLGVLDGVAKGRATTQHLYARYRAAKSGLERKIAGSLILINTPELAPAVFDKQNNARFWGCKASDAATSNDMVAQAPRYLSQEQLSEANKEQDILLKLPLRTEFIAPTLLEWVKQKPNDEEAPKALHFLIASTRMECPYTDQPEKDQLRARYSREAFNLLHKYYPNSKWARQTPYYF